MNFYTRPVPRMGTNASSGLHNNIKNHRLSNQKTFKT